MSAPVSTDDPLIGVDVGRYRLVRLLGKGGMGRVYEAIQPELGSRVAIKVISEDAADKPALLERFFAEARAVSMIRHDSIASVLDLTTLPNGRPVIVMELVEGRTLRDALRAAPPPLGGVIQVMVDVLGALGAAHAIGIVHRDLKPDNIIVTPSGRAKVLDFGIAKLSAQLHGEAPRTQTGVVLGTPEYMSPEQVTGAEVDARSDVYTAGVVLFEAVTGRRPFEAPSDFELMRQHLEQPAPSASTLRADLPEAIAQVIACALAKPRDHRFASAGAMANALQTAAASLPAGEWRGLVPDARLLPWSPTPPADLPTVRGTPKAREPRPDESLSPPTAVDRPTPVATRRSRRWAIIGVAGALAVAGGVVAGVVLGRHDHAPPADPVGSAAVAFASAPVDAAAVDAVTLDAAVAIAPPADAAAAPGMRLAAPARKPDERVLVPDYDPAHLDGSAFIAVARAEVRRVFSDAELTMVMFDQVHADGTLDARSGAGASLIFRSPSRSHDPRDTKCLIGLTANTMLAFGAYDRGDCTQPVIQIHCTLAQLWDRAKQRGVDASQPASFILVAGSWAMVTGRGPRERKETFDDRCDGVSPPPEATRVVTPSPPPRTEQLPPAPIDVSARPFNRVYPMDFDPARLDPFAYLAKARARARTIFDDAEVTSMFCRGVHRDGHVTFGHYDKCDFRFWSVRRTGPGPKHNKEGCEVVQILEADELRVAVDQSEWCPGDTPLGGRPRCTAEAIWEHARKNHPGIVEPFSFTWRPGKWTIEAPDPNLGHGWEESFPDDCK